MHSISEAASAKDSLFQISTVAQSDHLIYVYSITDPSDKLWERMMRGALSRLLANLYTVEPRLSGLL